ncbi:CoA pyrophosphatase [Bacillus sp. ISL-34]|uniref:NUDIX hydrolase n=1 Tax=Bacillus sp. ISL-34 TaxID=2819121 RepID=UPI001BE57A33|nr:CoA pyrophosphatase [Bacillus sp. ISL-34]MBT2648811.1 CoA pyrophosphatase [Bacillus sp. ISL-34]
MNNEDITKKLTLHIPEILGSGNFSKYAVLVPLIEKEDGIHVLFEERSHKLRRQPGDICFPGGKIDKLDHDEQAAALRETYEELNLRREDIDNVFPIDYLVSPFGMIVYPYAGFVRNHQRIIPNPAEVETIFTVPLSFFMEKPPEIYHVKYKVEPHENFPHDLVVGGENYKWQPKQMEEYFYLYNGRVIWGMTAKILTHFIEILR